MESFMADKRKKIVIGRATTPQVPAESAAAPAPPPKPAAKRVVVIRSAAPKPAAKRATAAAPKPTQQQHVVHQEPLGDSGIAVAAGEFAVGPSLKLKTVVGQRAAAASPAVADKRFPYEAMVAALPSPDQSVVSRPKSRADEWANAFRQYITVLLTSVYTRRSNREAAVSKDNLSVFIRAFTDNTFEGVSDSKTYETLETIGDKSLALAFTKYVYTVRPTVTDRELSNFISGYMYKKFQAELATELRMHHWILFGSASSSAREYASTDSYREDVFEAFFAALEIVGDRVHAAAVASKDYENAATDAAPGHELARRLVTAIFDSKGLDEEKSKTAAKTLILELGTLFGSRHHAVDFRDDAGKHSVIIHKQFKDILADAGIVQAIPTYLAKDEPDATTAARVAQETLRAVGVTDEWVREQRDLVQMTGITEENKAILATIKQKSFPRCPRNRISKFVFAIPEKTRKSDGSFTMILKAVCDDDTAITLASADGFVVHETKNVIIRNMVAPATA